MREIHTDVAGTAGMTDDRAPPEIDQNDVTELPDRRTNTERRHS